MSPPAARPPSPPPLLRDEDGMITVLSVVTVFGLAVLAALVGSVGAAVVRKVEAQNAADAVALSCSVQQARTLNAVTAVNHLTGELLAAVALHEAIGGHAPGEGSPRNTTAEDEKLDGLKQEHDLKKVPAELLAPGFKAETPAYKDVHEKVKSDNALLDAHRELKVSLAEVYRIKNLALLLVSAYPVPYVGQIISEVGQGLYFIANLVERLIDLEWNVLGGIELFAKNPAAVKVRDLIYDRVPNLRGHAGRFVSEVPSLVEDTAREIGRRNAREGAVHPTRPGLRVEPETVPLDAPDPPDDRLFFKPNTPPDERTRPDHWRNPPRFARSQLVRATYPLVNFHRVPVLSATRWLVFSQFARHYRNWSTEMTLTWCQKDYGRRDGPWLHVLADLRDPVRKASAPWFEDTRAAERAFAAVGFARVDAPTRWTTRYLPAANRDGVVAFAQGLVYNANARRPSPDDTRFQPVTGWDTLNWDTGDGDPAHGGAVEWPYYTRSHTPRVRLNWQAKLVPVTRLGEATSHLDADFQRVLLRLDPSSPLAHGH